MTNLPVVSNDVQTPARGAPSSSALQRNDACDAAGKASSASQSNNAQNDQSKDNFSAVLAHQISEDGASEPNFAKSATTGGGNAASGDAIAAEKKPKDQTINITDPANPLAAMLLQAPVQPSDAPVKAKVADNTSQRDDSADTGQTARPASRPIVTGTDAGIKKHSEGSRQPDVTSSTVAEAVAPAAMLANPAKHLANSADHTVQPLAIHNNSTAIVTGASSGVMPGMQAGGTPAPQNVATPLGNSTWANEFSQKIVWMSTQQNHSAELHLNPPDLGPLNVLLKISDNQLTAQFTSPHIAVRDALENALPKLREILADNNIMLGNATISDQPPRDRGEGSMNHGSGSAAQHGASYGLIGSNVTSPAAAVAVPVRRHIGMLDTFA